MPRQPPTYLTPKELAQRWRLGFSTIYQLKAQGQLSLYQLGGAIRFLLADVEAYEAAGREEAPLRPRLLRRKRRRIS